MNPRSRNIPLKGDSDMAGSFQNEIPSSRVNLKLDVGKDNTRKKMELPFKLLVIGDFTQKKPCDRVGDREKITIIDILPALNDGVLLLSWINKLAEKVCLIKKEWMR